LTFYSGLAMVALFANEAAVAVKLSSAADLA